MSWLQLNATGHLLVESEGKLSKDRERRIKTTVRINWYMTNTA